MSRRRDHAEARSSGAVRLARCCDLREQCNLVCAIVGVELRFVGDVEGSWSPLMGSLSLSLSLSLSVFLKMRFEGKIKTEIILHPTYGQTEKHFRKMYFSCATKYPHFRKNIFKNYFHQKQMHPKPELQTGFNNLKNEPKELKSENFIFKGTVEQTAAQVISIKGE